MLFQLEGRADLHVSTRYEARLNCENSRGTLRCMSALERNPEVLASTQMRTSAPEATAEESREAPRNLPGDWTFLRPHKRLPEVPVITPEEPQVCWRNLTKTRRFSPQSEMRPFSAVASREKSHLHV